jgi:hypothetical protein
MDQLPDLLPAPKKRESTTFAAALTHRMVTNLLPPVFGFFTTRWLTAPDYR